MKYTGSSRAGNQSPKGVLLMYTNYEGFKPLDMTGFVPLFPIVKNALFAGFFTPKS